MLLRVLAGVEIRAPDDFERAFESILDSRPEALLLVGGSWLMQNKQRTCDFP